MRQTENNHELDTRIENFLARKARQYPFLSLPADRL